MNADQLHHAGPASGQSVRLFLDRIKIRGQIAPTARPPSNGLCPDIAASPAAEVTRPGISPRVTLAKVGIRNVDEAEAERLMGFNERGILIPYFNLDGTPLNSPSGQPFYRLRKTEPCRGARYLSAKNSGAQLYISPASQKLLAPGCRLHVVEGEFKALSLVEAGFACVGIGGISAACRKSKSGDYELIPALAEIIAHARPQMIDFVGDNDTMFIPDFSREAIKISRLVGVPLLLPRIPIDAPGKGVDDLRKEWGPEFQARWQAILDGAKSVPPDANQAKLAVRLFKDQVGSISKLSPADRAKLQERMVKFALDFRNSTEVFKEILDVAVEQAGFSEPALVALIQEHESNRAQKAGEPASGTAPNGQPWIVLPGSDHSNLAAATAMYSLIAKSAQNRLFYRGGRVHEVAVNSNKSHKLSPVSPVQFCSLVEEYGQVAEWHSKADSEKFLSPTTCKEHMAKVLLASPRARSLLPNVITLAACPVLAKVGKSFEVFRAGWHNHGGGLYVTGGEFPPYVPLSEAVDALKALLVDFDFASPGDESRATASLIAPGLLFGGWLSGPMPIDMAEADASQAGKTYLQTLVAAIYREVPNRVAQHSGGGVGSFNESLAQKLIDNRPFVLIDNHRGQLDSPLFESIITASGPVPARVPYHGEVEVNPRSFIFQITSNQIETTPDLLNRTCITRIRKRPKGFPFQSFPEGDLQDHVRANQPYYLGCVFAVMAEWVDGGQLRTNESRHSFRGWARPLDWIVQNIFKSAPLLDDHDTARQRISDPRKSWLRLLCMALRDANRLVETFNASQLAEFALEHDLPPPNANGSIDEKAVALCIGKVMASTFGDSDLSEIDGFKIHRSKRWSGAAGKDINTYRFDQDGADRPPPIPPVPPVHPIPAGNEGKEARMHMRAKLEAIMRKNKALSAIDNTAQQSSPPIPLNPPINQTSSGAA